MSDDSPLPVPQAVMSDVGEAESDTSGLSDGSRSRFEVQLVNFSGPFDLLLSLISARKLDITEIALAEVTDEFLTYVGALEAADLGVVSEFLVVAATLLDLKAARLLPGFDESEIEDLELLEARDLLFAKLLQYRAFKDIAAIFTDRLAVEARRRPHAGVLEPQFAALLPPLEWTITAEELALLAAVAFQASPPPQVPVDHLHAPAVSVAEQASFIEAVLRRDGAVTFTDLVANETRLVAVARFLALLDLFRQGSIDFAQDTPLGALTIRWTGRAK
ncbi:MAG: segregation/condensation protein A [Cellulomonadaceae bacterium]|jgi:segregation and condensation protein A|nr:segregation/condensation protein A [Cellulomonadaceae bacterium]